MDNKEKVELIKKFLEGSDNHKYITGIESGGYGDNEVFLMIDHPEKGKQIEKHRFTPFVFVKDFSKIGKRLYFNKADRENSKQYNGISFKKLRTDGQERLDLGYSYIFTTNKRVQNLNNFFSKANYNLYKDPDRLFLYNPTTEQFLISTGKRLFKGFQSYNDIHKFYFDIETTGLLPSESSIFLIGIKDNRGYENVLQIDRDNPFESERQMIIDFFQIIMDLRPSIIAGYNSEAFDFNFILERAKIHNIDLGSKDNDGNMNYEVRTSLNPAYPIKRKPSTIKFGGETENYDQTIMWGYNVIDISHAVRKTMAINSDIKGWGLKYICKYSEIAKKDRMYVKDGGKIYKMWHDDKWYCINKKTNNYKLIPEEQQNTPEEYKKRIQRLLKLETKEDTKESVLNIKAFFDYDINNVDIIKGSEIIFQYLLDDLSETEMVDNRFNQSSFMLGAIAPTSYVRAATMGNASLWRLLMITYSYENKLAIPISDRKRNFVGGLSRLLSCGYAKNVLKMDFKSLYPSIQLTWDIFPKFDITGVLEAMLTYFRDARIEYQLLSKKYKDEGDSELANFYDTKQLPIKILANSNFGALSSPEIFNWGDVNLGEEITCRGRQYLRSMVSHFMSYGFQPLVLDTDGCNFSIPDDSENIKYFNKEGKEFTGYSAVLEEYNEKYMTGVMRLEEDGVYSSTINFARKNYANLIYDEKKGKYKVKLVGASIKSKTIPTYIEKFLTKGIKLLLDGNGKEFVEEYYDYLKKIYNREIPLIEIANKSKIKNKVAAYQHDQIHKKQVNGRPMPKQAHMELMIKNNMNPDLGEVIYFVNNGKVKSHGDIEHSYLLDTKELEMNPNKLGEYNVARAVANFNKKLLPLMVCFSDEVRNNLLVKNPKDRGEFIDDELILISAKPLPPTKKDKFLAQDAVTLKDYNPTLNENEPLMEMSKGEIIFWNKSRRNPNEIFSGFTTELSEIKLIDFNDDTYQDQFNKIFEHFINIDIKLKSQLDYLIDDDLVLLKDLNTWKVYKYHSKELHFLFDIDEEILKNNMH